MTGTVVSAPTGAQRLLGPAPDAPLPRLDVDQLVALVTGSGLTGRGGAGFPTARKLQGVAGRRPVVVGNGIEGEPLSSKDVVLLTRAPGLVVDGLTLLADTLGARRAVLAVGPRVPVDTVRQAAARTSLEVVSLAGGFVAGHESALVDRLDGGPGAPRDPLVPVYRRGVDRRPTLVLNVETLAHLALVARYGDRWFRSLGTTQDPGTFLTTITASHAGVLTHPGVLEVPRGVRLGAVLDAAGTDRGRVGAVLVGGYHGTWLTSKDLDVHLSVEGLARHHATPGAGVVHVLDRQACPLVVVSKITTYLAGESARQCGPCVNGLPRIADTVRALATPGSDPGLVAEAERLRRLVHGRGSCAHPDGTSRFVASSLQVFSAHVRQHLGGECRADAR